MKKDKIMVHNALYRRLKSDQHESTDYSGELRKVKRFMLLKGEHFLLHWHLQRSECTQNACHF
jgi:hypothetical protein